jgi:hypothetical protein
VSSAHLVVSVQEGFSCAKSSFGGLQMAYFNWLDDFYLAYQVSSGRLGTVLGSWSPSHVSERSSRERLYWLVVPSRVSASVTN